eukprot:scaffold7034_cov31-Tisochrysis_lutea.AAC.4
MRSAAERGLVSAGFEANLAARDLVAVVASLENWGWSCCVRVGWGSTCPRTSRGTCACLGGGSKATPTAVQPGMGGSPYASPPGGASRTSPAMRGSTRAGRTSPQNPALSEEVPSNSCANLPKGLLGRDKEQRVSKTISRRFLLRQMRAERSEYSTKTRCVDEGQKGDGLPRVFLAVQVIGKVDGVKIDNG